LDISNCFGQTVVLHAKKKACAQIDTFDFCGPTSRTQKPKEPIFLSLLERINKETNEMYIEKWDIWKFWAILVE